MRTKDRIIKEKIVNKNPSLDILREAAKGDYSHQREGMIRIVGNSQQDSDPAFHTMQEHHNANHALWYLTMIVHAITHDKPHQNTEQKTERVLAHLSHLREFIQDPSVKHRLMIDRIFDSLVSETPKTNSQWTHIIYVNWNLIQNFAETSLN